MKKINLKKRAKEVLEIEAKAVLGLKKNIGSGFQRAIEAMLRCKGRIVVSGMGKAGIIGQKLSATLSSTGTPSLFLHSAEAIHGDLGRVTREDVVLILSNSGETEEIKKLLPILKKIGAKVIAITGNIKSLLSHYSDITLNSSVQKEACPLGLAPTASTTAMLAISDALAVCLLESKDFKEKDFAFYHPGGALGRRLLLRVEDIMRTGQAHAIVKADKKVSQVLVKITQCRAGSASVVDNKGRLVGIFTDGDLRRHLETDSDLSRRRICEMMTKNPTVVRAGMLAVEAMRILEEKKIDEVPVVDKRRRPIGLLDVQDLLKAGLV